MNQTHMANTGMVGITMLPQSRQELNMVREPNPRGQHRRGQCCFYAEILADLPKEYYHGLHRNSRWSVNQTHIANTGSPLLKSNGGVKEAFKDGEAGWARAGVKERGKKVQTVINAGVVTSRVRAVNGKAVNLKLPCAGTWI